LSANIQKLNTDLDTLNEKYQNDIALNEEQIRNLEQKYSLLESDSTLKITDLSFLVADLEMKRAQEIKALNEQIATQNNAFSKQLDDFKQQSAQREFELSSALNAAQKSLAAKEFEVSTLKAANSDIAVQLSTLTEQLAQSQFARDQIERELKSMKAATEVSFQKLKGGPGQLLLNTR
jgi:chromosome segregation ATPase